MVDQDIINYIRHARSNKVSDAQIELFLVNERGYPEDIVREAMIDPASLAYTEYVRMAQTNQPLPKAIIIGIIAVVLGIGIMIMLFLVW